MGERSIKDRISTYFNIVNGKKSESMKAYTEHIFQIVDKTMSYSISNHPLPLCMIDSEGRFLWFNKKFSDIYQDADIANAGISRATGLKAADFFTEDPVEKPVIVSHGGKTYRVVSSYLDEDKKLRLVLSTVELPYKCPLIEEKMTLQPAFIQATYTVWKRLIKDPLIWDLVEMDSREIRRQGCKLYYAR